MHGGVRVNLVNSCGLSLSQSRYVYQIAKKIAKTYNSGYSLVVTHLTTDPPVRCLNRAERTGSLVFNVLWSYVKVEQDIEHYQLNSDVVEAD